VERNRLSRMTEAERSPVAPGGDRATPSGATEKPRRRGGFAANRERASLAGKRGAKTVKDRLGTEHYQRLGKMGGAAVKQKYGPDYYREIGKRGGRSRWDAEKARGQSGERGEISSGE
jgi:general stress protein YciG